MHQFLSLQSFIQRSQTPALTVLGAKMETMEMLKAYPALSRVVDAVLAVWPEHENYCTARFKDDSADFLKRMDEVSVLVLRNTGDDLAQFCADYRWMCEEFLKEEMHFRRFGDYRLKTFAEAYEQVYGLDEYMSRYVRGILISQVIWEPHAKAFDFFRTNFLGRMEDNSKYLEVGPGHGLFLYFASQSPQLASLEAWDVSQSSIAATKKALGRLGVERLISIVEQDILKAPSRSDEFNAAVISEVLEHLERPDVALKSLNAALRPGGRIFINAPINSPAPDHIYLWRSTDEFIEFVKAQGFGIEEAVFLPVTGASLERARKRDLSISCVVIGVKL